jgi:peptidyl-prolyl cis-trans isomerase A (cyclophilin A)
MHWRCACTLAALLLAACSAPEEANKHAAATAPAKSGRAPEVFKVNLDTSKGMVVVEVHRAWAPIGADHFYSLIGEGFYDGARFYRVVRNFVAQFGINGDPQTNRLWATANLPDDPVRESNAKGTLTYATTGPRGRTTQLFFNLKDNRSLDKEGFAPIGKVVEGMDVVERLYNSYGDIPPRGNGPDPNLLQQRGNDYLANRFPRLDYVKKAAIAGGA